MLRSLLLRREVTVVINRLLDQWLPPVLRDARWFMWVPMRLFAGKNAPMFMAAKDTLHRLTPEQYEEIYAHADSMVQHRPTDLHPHSIARIRQDIVGDTVLDAGCGRGILAGLLVEKFQVTGCDITIPQTVRDAFPKVIFHETILEKMPFPDKAFDTIICAHTLEHVLDLPASIGELRRLARRRLIIVVPRQRASKYTFDLHVRFFPYEHSLYYAFGGGIGRRCELVGGDWYYVEEMQDQ